MSKTNTIAVIIDPDHEVSVFGIPDDYKLRIIDRAGNVLTRGIRVIEGQAESVVSEFANNVETYGGDDPECCPKCNSPRLTMGAGIREGATLVYKTTCEACKHVFARVFGLIGNRDSNVPG